MRSCFAVPIWSYCGPRRRWLPKAAGSSQLCQSIKHRRRRLSAKCLGSGHICLEFFQVAFQLSTSVLEPGDDLCCAEVERRRNVVTVCRRQILLTPEAPFQLTELMVGERCSRLSPLSTRSKTFCSGFCNRHQLMMLSLLMQMLRRQRWRWLVVIEFHGITDWFCKQ